MTINKLFDIPLTSLMDWIALVVGIGMVVYLLIHLYFYLFVYRRLISYKKKDVKSDTEPVSIIICARNEADNLRANLPHVLNQFYPDFEVIVVNDGSTDESADVLAEMKKRYPMLYVTGIEPREGYSGGKKLAQTIGIKAAHHDQLLFIDADCKPASVNWIRQMQSNFLKQTEIILGHVSFNAYKGFLNKWIRTDMLYISMQYLSFAIKRHPFMGRGGNLAYRRELFFRNKGHARHLQVKSGDDDLFINETANHLNTAVELHPDSFTVTDPKRSWKSYIRQKRRHLSSGFLYKKQNKFLLSLESLSRFLFYASVIFLLAIFHLPGYALVALLIRIVSQLIVFKLVMNRLKERNLLLTSLLYDICWPAIAGFLVLTTKLKRKPTKWN